MTPTTSAVNSAVCLASIVTLTQRASVTSWIVTRLRLPWECRYALTSRMWTAVWALNPMCQPRIVISGVGVKRWVGWHISGRLQEMPARRSHKEVLKQQSNRQGRFLCLEIHIYEGADEIYATLAQYRQGLHNTIQCDVCCPAELSF